MANQKEVTGVKFVELSLLKSSLREDHMKSAILRACERLDLAINNTKKSFSDKVEVLMSVLENLMADCLTRVLPETILLVFEYLLRHTLLLVFHDNWGLNKIAKSHVCSLFKQFKIRAEKNKLADVVGKIDYLVILMGNDPWGNAALMEILSGGKESVFQFFQFVKQEMGIFLIVRLHVMIYAQCEVQAMMLIEKCLQYVSTFTHLFLPSFCNEITYLRDLYLILLNKAKNNPFVRGKILHEVNKMGLAESLKCVQRCQQGLLPFETLSKKTADVVLNMALASCVIKEDTDENIFQELIKIWFDFHGDDQVLSRLLKHMVHNAVCSRYIYSFGQILIERFNLSKKALCVEVYVRGLSLNINEIERCELKDEKDNVREFKVQLSKGFLKLADYLKEDFFLCRECVLTAFSLDPSLSCFERIKYLGGKSRKIFIKMKKKNLDIENKPSLINVGERVLPHFDKNLAIGMERCELDPAPLLTKEVFNVSDHNKMERSNEFDVTSTSVLSPQRPLVHDIVHADGTKALNVLLKNNSEQTQPNEQIINENQTNDILKGTFNFVLTKESSDLPLDGDNSIKNHHEEIIHAYNGESVGIPQSLCDDLSTLVSHGRNQQLTWDLSWDELSRRCESYILHWEGKDSNERLNLSIFKEGQYKIHNKNREKNSNRAFVIPIRISKRKRKQKKTAEYND